LKPVLLQAKLMHAGKLEGRVGRVGKILIPLDRLLLLPEAGYMLRDYHIFRIMPFCCCCCCCCDVVCGEDDTFRVAEIRAAYPTTLLFSVPSAPLNNPGTIPGTFDLRDAAAPAEIEAGEAAVKEICFVDCMTCRESHIGSFGIIGFTACVASGQK
jgi:hypothetical protein